MQKAIARLLLVTMLVASCVFLQNQNIAEAAPTTPTFVSAGAGDDIPSSPSDALDCAYPSSLAANDLIILQIGARSDDRADIASISGFTRLFPATGEDQNPNGYQTLWYKFSSGSESGTLSVTLNGTANSAVCRMYAFRNVALSSFTEGATTANISTGSLTMPSVVTSSTGRLAVIFSSIDQNVAMAASTGESGGDWTEPVAEFTTGIGSNFGIQLQTADMSSGGTISGGTSNFGGGTDDGIARAFALIGIDTATSTAAKLKRQSEFFFDE